MTEKNETLLPCPLCGVGPEMLMTGFYYGHSVKQCEPEKRDAVMCLGCGVRAPLKSWNTRTAAASAEPVAPSRTDVAKVIDEATIIPMSAWCPPGFSGFSHERFLPAADAVAKLYTHPAPDAEIVAAAGKMPGYVSCNPEFERGYRAGREDAEKDVRAALAKAKGGSQQAQHVSLGSDEDDGQHGKQRD